MTNYYRTLVKDAALMLDEVEPGWEKRIDPKTLRMSSCANCVLGQIFGPNVESHLWRMLGPRVRAARRRLTVRHTQGFQIGLRRINYEKSSAFGGDPALRCMWIEEIIQRREPNA